MMDDRIILPLVSPNLVLRLPQERPGRPLQRLLQPADLDASSSRQ